MALTDRLPHPGISPVSRSVEYGLSSIQNLNCGYPINPVAFIITNKFDSVNDGDLMKIGVGTLIVVIIDESYFWSVLCVNL